MTAVEDSTNEHVEQIEQQYQLVDPDTAPASSIIPHTHSADDLLAERSTDEELFTLTTFVKPPRKFRVRDVQQIGGEELIKEHIFQLYSPDHIGKVDEAKVVTLFRRHTKWVEKQDRAKNRSEMENAAIQIQRHRYAIIEMITDIKEVLGEDIARGLIERLPISAQARIINEYTTIIPDEDSTDEI